MELSLGVEKLGLGQNNPGMRQIARGQRGIINFFEGKALESVKLVEIKYGVKITTHDFEAYCLGLAARILDFAKQHLPGLLIEAVTYEERYNQSLERGAGITEVIRSALAGEADTHTHVREAIHNIQRFYHDAISTH